MMLSNANNHYFKDESIVDTLIGLGLMLGLCMEVIVAMAFLSLWVGR